MALLLDTKGWKEFRVGDLFDVTGSITTPFEDLEATNIGEYPYITTSASNNGVAGFFDKFTETGNIICIESACAGFATYQPQNFTASDHVEKLLPKFDMNAQIALFLVTMLNAEQYKYNYGRKCNQIRIRERLIKLPATPSGDPDWQFMEDYIKSLHHKPLTTKNKHGRVPALNVQNWKYYQLHDLCTITMGNKMDFSAMNTDEPAVNFVGRSADNNGIMGKVDYVLDDNGQRIKPYPAGCITIALGGSLGSTYLQREPFYTSQNVSVIEFDESISDYAKLFMCTLIHNESLYKYFPFGRELNTHIRTDFGFTLPVDADGNPDWQFMEDYIKALPYGDRI